MAYVSKEMKAEIVKAVKEVLPKDWKATFGVTNLSTLVMTISKAPLVLEDTFTGVSTEYNNYTLNHYSFKNRCKDEKVTEILEKIIKAINCLNHDNSDVMTDYFDVGYYVVIQFGSWKKDFISTK